MYRFAEIQPLFIIAIIYMIIAFILYYLLVFYFKKKNTEDNSGYVFLTRLTGFLLFGIIPLVYLLSNNRELSDFGFNSRNIRISLYSLLIATPVLFTTAFFNAKKEQNQKLYPEIRKVSWSIKLLILSSSSWLMYILAYEFLFRGIILFTSIGSFNYWPAVFINIILYALAHIPKGIKETLASVPFGLVLCIISLETGSFLGSFFIHGTLALMNEWLSLKAHPQIHLKL